MTLARFTSRSPHPTILETIDDLTPDAELAALLGCRMGEAGVEVDEYQQTSVEGVYCAGEATGIGGLDLSLTKRVPKGADLILVIAPRGPFQPFEVEGADALQAPHRLTGAYRTPAWAPSPGSLAGQRRP